MDPTTAAALIALNRRFYENYGAAFASTRRRLQDGVRRVLALLPDGGAAPWLDLGCGSGALAVEWLRQGRQSPYLGLDFSSALLNEARAAVAAAVADAEAADAEAADATSVGPSITFRQADLSQPDWADGLFLQGGGAPGSTGHQSEPPGSKPPASGAPGGGTPGGGAQISGAMAFAVFHHLPSRELRLSILRRAHELLPPGGWFVHSEWQFQHSPKLMERRLPWSTVGLDEAALEPGDTLLDWRHTLPGHPRAGAEAPEAGAPEAGDTEAEGRTEGIGAIGAVEVGLRYVHLFTREELDELARAAGFRVLQTFESDGKGGRLGLYQVWEKE